MKGILKNKSDPLNNINEQELQHTLDEHDEEEESEEEEFDEEADEDEEPEFHFNDEVDEDDEVDEEENGHAMDGLNRSLDEGEQLRLQYEFQMKQLLDQVIGTLPMNQLEYFQETFQQQQIMFQSFLLSQKINHQYQRYIRRQMRQEMKRQIATSPTAANGSTAIHNPLVVTEGVRSPNSSTQNPSALSIALASGGIESTMLSPQRREFYQYAQRAVDCLSKEQQKVNEYNMTMEIVWQLFPVSSFSAPPTSASNGAGEEKKRKPIIFHCSYNGDNEGDGNYHWQLGKYSQDYSDYKTPNQLKISQRRLEKMSKLLGVSREDCHQILHGMFCSSFWSDV